MWGMGVTSLIMVTSRPSGLQGADGSLTAGAGALHEHFHGFQPMLHSGLGGGLSRDLGGKRRGLPGTAEAQLAGARPGQGVALTYR